MARFGRVDEERGRPRTRERRGDLARDMPGFADSRNDHTSLAFEQNLDRMREPVVETVNQRTHRVRFDLEHLASELQGPISIDFRYHSRSITKPS